MSLLCRRHRRRRLKIDSVSWIVCDRKNFSKEGSSIKLIGGEKLSEKMIHLKQNEFFNLFIEIGSVRYIYRMAHAIISFNWRGLRLLLNRCHLVVNIAVIFEYVMFPQPLPWKDWLIWWLDKGSWLSYWNLLNFCHFSRYQGTHCCAQISFCQN